MNVRTLARPVVCVLGVCCAAISGCATFVPAGPLRAQSTGSEGNMLFVDRSEAVYATAKQPESSFIVSTVPISELIEGKVETGQVVHIELLWVPKGGATPISASATNVSIRHVVFADGEVGVYEGAGFALPEGEVGDNTLSLSLMSATLRLKHSTAGFVDKLGDAEMLGGFEASLNTSRTAAARFALSQLVTDAMGKSMWVREATDGAAHDEAVHEAIRDIEADLNLVLARLEASASAVAVMTTQSR